MTRDRHLHLYRLMKLARTLELRLTECFAAGQIPGWIHSGMGQEVTGAVLGSALQPEDYLVPSHRARISLIAKGTPLNQLVAEVFCKATGCNHGKGGEVHLADLDHNIFGSGGILGATIPIAVGLAYAAVLRQGNQVAACLFGDGTSRRGTLHESLNMAALWKLPLVLVCENNRFSEMARVEDQVAGADISGMAAAYGIPGITVDTRDVLATDQAIREAIDRARNGQGPTLIETRSFRMRGHFEGDDGRQRPPGEAEEMHSQDPVVLFEQYLLETGVLDPSQVTITLRQAREQVEAAVQFALVSPVPSRDQILSGAYV